MSVWYAKALDVGPFLLVYFLFSVDKRGWCIPLSPQLVACKWLVYMEALVQVQMRFSGVSPAICCHFVWQIIKGTIYL